MTFGPRNRISSRSPTRTSNPAVVWPEVSATVLASSSGRHLVAPTASVTTVGGETVCKVQLGLHTFHERDGHGGGAGYGKPQAGQIALGAGRGVQQHLVDRGCAGQDGDPLGFDQPQRFFDVELEL